MQRPVIKLRRPVLRIVIASLVLPLLIFLGVPPYLLDDVSFSRAVTDRNGELLRLTLSADDKYRLFVPYDEISPLLVQAVLTHEDKYFFHHPGVNPFAIAQAAWKHVVGGRGGASTLTMQLARLRLGINTRSVVGKIVQMAEALRIELHYSKKHILEAYLNLAPYGGNVEGVGAASEIYFGRPANQLSLPEALTLAVIPQSPAKRSPGKSIVTNEALSAARKRLFSEWIMQHPDDGRYASLLTHKMQYGSVRNLPFIAPQFANHVLRQYANGTIVTTLDKSLQVQLSGLLERYVQHHRELNIANAAALLVDTSDMGVIASIGSARFFDVNHQGMLDGTRARRSPGSALKPFIYALAFDQGIIHPLSLLADAPTAFATYAPENFDHQYEGPLSAHDALIKSRNIPALWVAEQLTHPDFYHFLIAAGIEKLKPQAVYGLSLVLGGAEVTMEEMAKLYAMLANGGKLQPLRLTKADSAGPGIALISPEAAFMTLDILRDTPVPGGSALADNLTMPIYWKTGTSGGFRDAWSVGISGYYALVVWTGDFHGSAHGHYTGISSAAPLFFELMRAVIASGHSNDLLAAKPAHLHLAHVLACSDTGDINIPYCPAREEVWIIPGISPIKPTGIYQRVLMDNATGKRACRFNDNTSYRVMQFWPSALTDVFSKAGIHKAPAPEWNEGCSVQSQGHSVMVPHILSPAKGSSYHLRDKSDNNLPLKASFDGSVRTAYWFINNVPIGRATPDEVIFWQMKTGQWVIRVVDDSGNADSRIITVE